MRRCQSHRLSSDAVSQEQAVQSPLHHKSHCSQHAYRQDSRLPVVRQPPIFPFRQFPVPLPQMPTKNKRQIIMLIIFSSLYIIFILKSQSHYPYRFVGTLIEFIVKGRFASWHESTLLHHSSRSWVADEMSADERLDVSCIADMRYHQSKSLCADTLVPIRFAHPIPHRWFSFPSRERAFARRTVAHGSYCLASLIPYDSRK